MRRWGFAPETAVLADQARGAHGPMELGADVPDVEVDEIHLAPRREPPAQGESVQLSLKCGSTSQFWSGAWRWIALASRIASG